ncbi:MAG: M10 family metallopeptidase C-terminal domain-containing protein [Marinobacterium sp.]|nr:M10 family metallopeptidase C-terminal domain-containing protein [Marinobacterium sp.]
MSNRLVDASDDLRVNSLLSGAKWGEGAAGEAAQISYSFPAGTAYWKYTDEVNAGWYGLSTSQRQAFEAALQGWTEVAGLTMTRVTDDITYGDIRVGYSYKVADNVSGYAYLPGSGAVDAEGVITPDAQAGDIWLNPSLTELSTGSHGYYTLMHEIGHALGLKHSFEVEGSFPALEALRDNTRYTVMSYTDSTAAGYRFVSLGDGSYQATVIKPKTPMLYDILAIQHLYGANTDTRSDDTTYTFATRAEMMTIWDGGGTDTIDLSNQLIAANLNLQAGTFSDIGQRQLNFGGTLELADDNIAIAYGVEIENAIGTLYSDTLTGNALDNRLTGGTGNDTLDGGDGDDTAVFAGNRADYAFRKDGSALIVEGADGRDHLTSIENLVFDDQTVAAADLTVIDGSPVAAVPTSKAEVDHTPTEGQTAYFLLELSSALSTSASVSYSTRDGTAEAGKDYVATSGTATLQPGQTFVTIAVELLDDGVVEANEYFELAVRNPVGGTFPAGEIELVAQRIIIDNDA